MEYLPKTKKIGLTSGFSIGHNGDWGRAYQKSENNWKFHSYKGTNSVYDVLCESVNYNQEEKEGDLLNGIHIINLKNLITNIYKCLV